MWSQRLARSSNSRTDREKCLEEDWLERPSRSEFNLSHSVTSQLQVPQAPLRIRYRYLSDWERIFQIQANITAETHRCVPEVPFWKLFQSVAT